MGGGGGLRVTTQSNVSWTGNTNFTGNRANTNGGAVYVSTGENITVGGDTHFLDNEAAIDGGGLFAYVGYGEAITSYIFIDDYVGTIFRGNKCGGNGGGIAFIGAVVTDFPPNMAFLENHAEVTGGAVYFSRVRFGPLFKDIKFIFNSALVGGAVYATVSGNVNIGDEYEDLLRRPTRFVGCEFIGNEATTGGAMKTSAGIEEFNDTLFARNTASSGGALHLAGTATLDGCTFIENSSDEDEGPGVFNGGVISCISNSNFTGNVFNCERGSYLGYNSVSPTPQCLGSFEFHMDSSTIFLVHLDKCPRTFADPVCLRALVRCSVRNCLQRLH